MHFFAFCLAPSTLSSIHFILFLKICQSSDLFYHESYRNILFFNSLQIICSPLSTPPNHCPYTGIPVSLIPTTVVSDLDTYTAISKALIPSLIIFPHTLSRRPYSISIVLYPTGLGQCCVSSFVPPLTYLTFRLNMIHLLLVVPASVILYQP